MVNDDGVRVAEFDSRFFGLAFDDAALDRLIESGPGSWVSWWSGMSARFISVDGRPRGVRMGSAPACNSSSVMTVGPEIVGVCEAILGEYGEFLPVETERGQYWAFHCLHEVSALDEDRCRDVDWVDDPSVPGGRRLLFVAGIAFRPEVARAARVFVLPERPGRSAVYFSREVVEELQAATGGFTGTEFRLPY